jgi:transposase
VFPPSSYPPDEEQVDYGFRESSAGRERDGERRVRTEPAVLRHGVRAEVPAGCTETIQEGHARAVAFLGNGPARIAYDNTKTPMAKIVGTRDRELNREFLRPTSHYLFALHFCPVRDRTSMGTSSGRWSTPGRIPRRGCDTRCL